VGDLFGFLFLFLIEKDRSRRPQKENRISTCQASLIYEPHAFCCFQGMSLCLYFLSFRR